MKWDAPNELRFRLAKDHIALSSFRKAKNDKLHDNIAI